MPELAGNICAVRARTWLVHVASSLPLLAMGAIREPLAYRIDSWNGENGLPQSSVTSITQTRDGYIWLGTFGGLARFDGAKFKVFDASSTPRLPSSRVLSVFEDRDGALWIGTEDGLVTRSVGGRLEVFSPPHRATVSKFIKFFAQCAEPGLWMVSAEGQLLRFAGGQFSVLSTNWNLKGGQAQTVLADASGRLWVGTEKELAFWQGTNFSTVIDQDREAGFGVDGLAISRAGGLWVAGNGRLRRFDQGKWVDDYGAYPWPKGVISEMREDRKGQVWLGIYGSGLFCYATNGTMLNLSRTEGLPGNSVRSLLEDHEGNIWAGIEGHGLARVKRAVFRSYGREQGLSSDLVMTVCEGQDGELWIGTNGEGIDCMKSGAVKHFGSAEGLSNEWVWAVCQDRNRTVWAGTWGGGLFRSEGNRFSPFPQEEGSGAVVCALYEDSSGGIWLGQVGRGPELLRLKEGKPGLVKLPTRAAELDVRAMAEDSTGNVWVGTRGDGLFKLSHGQQKRFGEREGLSSEFILSLYADADGVLWIGTRNGLHREQNEQFTRFSSEDGLVQESILSIMEDSRRNLWCGSGVGIFRVNKDELNREACGQAATIHCIAYTRADGLPSLECSSGCQPAGCKTRDGLLWFPTVNGLAVVNPEDVPFNPLPPPVLIDDVRIERETVNSVFTVPPSRDGEAGELGVPEPHPIVLRVPPGKQRLEFHYTALSFTAPEKIRFKYRLEGLENDWVEAGSERAAHYSYVRPGDYRFRVLACNNDGVWNEEGASLALIVLPHVWQTWWFRLLAVGSVLLLFVAVYEMRLALERRLNRLRLRMARDLHDEVGSNLSTIALLGEVLSKQPQTGQTEVPEIRRVAAQTIDSLRDIVWFLDPAADDMSELVLRMRETAKAMLCTIGFEFSSAGEADAARPSLELRRNVLPMFKEILHNVTQHAQATRVEINIEISHRQFLLRVRDNGIGFDQAQVRGGNGLRNLRRRTADLCGSVEIQSAPSSGTTITITAPIP